MDNDVLVSIIVPVYNVENYLRRCLDSLVRQTLQNIEIIVVNDGSPDNSQLIIDEYVRKYPGKVFGLIKENGGLSDARNFGIPHARGKYLGFVDSDDYVEITMYEKLLACAEEEEADITTCGYCGIDEQTGESRIYQVGDMTLFNQNIFECPKLLYSNAPYAWNKLYRRDLFEKTGILYPKGLLFEDIATTYPLMLYANKISRVPEPLYYYILKREGAITATYSENITQILLSLGRMNDYYIHEERFGSFKKSLLFMNMKHIFTRFEEYDYYMNKPFQRKFLQLGFDHLDKYFPDWRESEFYFNFMHKDFSDHKRNCYRNEKYWQRKITFKIRPKKETNKVKLVKKKRPKSKKEWVKGLFESKRSFQDRSTYVYAWNRKHLPIQKNKVVFESFHGSGISDSPLFMLKEIMNDPKYDCYFATNDYDVHKKFVEKNHLHVTLVRLNSFKYVRLIARAEYLINNVSFPGYFMKRKGQKLINTWHGTPLKTLGKNMPCGIESMHNIQHNFLQADLLLFPNEFTRKCIMDDYNLTKLYTGDVFTSGYPRNVAFFNKEREKEIRSEYGLTGKTVFTYMPTWRGKNSIAIDSAQFVRSMHLFMKQIDTRLNDDQVFYVNLHPNIRSAMNFNKYGHIKPFPSDVNNYEFLNCADVLITDYSSVFFDYSVTGKPVILFMYDYQEYMESRNTYFDVNSLPFIKIYDIDELVRVLLNGSYASQSYLGNKEYVEKFIPYDNKDASKELMDIFMNDVKGDRLVSYEKNAEKVWDICFVSNAILQESDFELLIQKYNSENTLFVFERRFFSPSINAWMYHTYNAKMQYIIITSMEITSRFKKFWYRFNRKAESRFVQKQDLKRCLPNVKIGKIETAQLK